MPAGTSERCIAWNGCIIEHAAKLPPETPPLLRQTAQSPGRASRPTYSSSTMRAVPVKNVTLSPSPMVRCCRQPTGSSARRAARSARRARSRRARQGPRHRGQLRHVPLRSLLPPSSRCPHCASAATSRPARGAQQQHLRHRRRRRHRARALLDRGTRTSVCVPSGNSTPASRATTCRVHVRWLRLRRRREGLSLCGAPGPLRQRP